MHEFLTEKSELLKQFNSCPELGLTDEQARGNAEKYGQNTLTKAKPESLFARIRHAAAEPMIIMLIIAGLLALFVNIFNFYTVNEADFLEVVGIFTAIALSVGIAVGMEGRSAKAFDALNRMNEDVLVRALRNGETVMIRQQDVVAGDILLIATGDKIAADGRLLESMELSTDESALTGESYPARKNAEIIITDEKTPVAERHNMLYAGTYVTNGLGKLLVTAVGDGTEFGKIAGELSVIDKTTTPLQEKLARLGKKIVVAGVIAASIAFIAQVFTIAKHGELIPQNVLEIFIISIILIVAAVPEGLPTIVAISLSISIIKLSKENALVKKIIASETVGSVNIICSDKTGTLTQNRMTVVGEISDEYISRNVCVNSTTDIGAGGEFIGNPTEGALITAAVKAGWDYKLCRHSAEIVHIFPFTSEEKNMTTVVKTEETYVAYTKGSPEKIFTLCNIPFEKRTEIENQITEYQSKAYRIIAFAHRNFYTYSDELSKQDVEQDMVFDGFVAISDPLRGDVYEAVHECYAAGVMVKMLTGDNIVTARAIAEELHLLDGGRIAVEARELEGLSDKELMEYLPKIGVIARSTPAIKMRVVKLLKVMGNVVAVTGDGINDAPALKNADVGIAMGITGTEVSKEAADIVLLNDSFATIVKAIRWGRGLYENFKRFICFQLTANVSSLGIVLVAVLMGFKAPFTALQLLWINIIMDGPPALTLGLEPARDGLMKRPPVKRTENILTKPLLIRIGVTGVYISAVVLLQYTFNFLNVAEEQISTVSFGLLSLFLLFNAFNCRELGVDSIFPNFMKNRPMLLVTAVTIVLQVLLIQYAGMFFGTVPLCYSIWLKLFGITISVVVLSELVKFVIRCRRTAVFR